MTELAMRYLRPSGLVKLRGGPAVEPCTAGAAVAALERLTFPGAPRWAAVGWAVDLAGPWRSMPRMSDDGDPSRAGLERLIQRLAPEPAREQMPEWLGRTDRDVDVLLALGTASGKPGKKLVVDIPAGVRGLVVDIPDPAGLVRFVHPRWTGDPLTSDGRLAGLVELVSAESDRDALAVLVGWCVGAGRADIGAWARRHPGDALAGEATSPAARKALGQLTGAGVEEVVGAVLAGAL